MLSNAVWILSLLRKLDSRILALGLVLVALSIYTIHLQISSRSEITSLKERLAVSATDVLQCRLVLENQNAEIMQLQLEAELANAAANAASIERNRQRTVNPEDLEDLEDYNQWFRATNTWLD